MDAKARVQSYEAELVERLGKLVEVNSVEGKPTADAPFGEGPKEVLHRALDMMTQDGFKTVNLDNYVGYAEMGEGEEVIGIIGHLDVVPADKNDGWDTDPFTMVEKDGILYGRGVSDDKGAVVASMIAMKVLRDMQVPVNKRIRLIMGTNEETGSKCLAHYVEKEGDVNYGFTPDGDFPGVYGEKGMLRAVYRSKQTKLLDLQGGMAANVVCARCKVKVEKNSYSNKKLFDYFSNNSIEYDIKENDDFDEIEVYGIPAHASTPELGTNAISYLLVGLKEAGLQDSFVDFYCNHFGLTTDGSLMGCACEDEYGALTENNGVISMKDGIVEGTIDIRFPVTKSVKQILKMLENRLEDEDGTIEILGSAEPLFYPPESPLVSCLVNAYREVTGDMESQPMTMGGGTYAKGIGNTIAFGCAFPGKDYHIHNANEYVEIRELLLQAEIYVQALLKLLEI